MEFLEGETVQNILKWLAALIVVATAIAAVTPSGKDDTILQKIGDFADKVGIDIKGLASKVFGKKDK